MLPKKRIIESKNSANNAIKYKGISKSISLLINTPHLNNNNISKRFHLNIVKKSNSIDKTIKNQLKFSKNKKSSKIFNLNLKRQNSQGMLYSLKNLCKRQSTNTY